VLQRVLEKKASLRNVADDTGVSQETIRRVVRAARCAYKASLRTDMPRSQHTPENYLAALEEKLFQKSFPT
jgi:transposase-like protein